jgi:serine phosphatase RsbU (regulator of sigma subunit)
VLVYLLFNLQEVEGGLVETAFKQQKEEVVNRLNSFFKPVEAQLEVATEIGSFGRFNQYDLQEFDEHFIPLIKTSSAISSLMMANQQGEELMLLDANGQWFNRETVLEEGSLNSKFYEVELKGKELAFHLKREEGEVYDPRLRPWFKGANETKGFFWTEPYVFFTTKDLGITVSKKWERRAEDTCVFAFDVMLKDLCNFTRDLKIEEHGKVFILTEDHRLLGLPNETLFDSEDSVKQYLLKPIEDFPIEGYQELMEQARKDDTNWNWIEYRAMGKEWVASLFHYQLGNRRLVVGEIALRADFQSRLRKSRGLLLYGVGLILIFMVFMIRAYWQKGKSNKILRFKQQLLKKTNQQIKEQRELLEQTHQETIESITYAKRVQEAALSPTKSREELFPDSFILLLPKDIVSGDFYWYAEVDGHKLIAAIDCTGHGVPGALMSMLGISFLGEIVEKNRITDPALILAELRRLVIAALNQSDFSVQNDGMDMALISFNEEMTEAVFAGAKNPLYLIRENELAVFKADKLCIGYDGLKGETFTNQYISLQNGDALYIFTDGYADQFGGDRDKKYLYSRMKEYLLSITSHNMQKQRALLLQEFEAWKGENEQIDDVCVIGVRV